MSRRYTSSLAASMLLVLMSVLSIRADIPIPFERIGGPLCVVLDEQTGVSMPLSPEQSQYNVVVTDGLAYLSLTQLFVNKFVNVNDMVYVFPLPHNGSVHAMSMEYRDSIYNAEIYEKQQAQHLYDSVVTSGGNAALLLEERPNVFQQRLANIAVGESAWVRIELSMPLKYANNLYELALPTLVAQRYGGGVSSSIPAGDLWNPPASVDGQRVQFNVLIQTGYPIANISSPTHPMTISQLPALRSTLEKRGVLSAKDNADMPYNNCAILDQAQSYANKDFVLRFRRSRTTQDFAMASYFDKKSTTGYFALNLFPDEALSGSDRPNIELVMLVDISGSQSGWPLRKEQEAVNALLDKLLPTDRLSLCSFNRSQYWAFSRHGVVDASTANIATARRFTNGLKAGGGTELLSAIQEILATPQQSEHQRIFVFLTDGFITNEAAIFNELRDHPPHPTVFTFGAGNNLNRYFLETSASIGNGFATEMTEFESAAGLVDNAWRMIESAQIKNVTLDFGGNDTAQLIMPLGSSLFKGKPLTVYGRYTVGGARTVTVKGYRSGEPVSMSRTIMFATRPNLNRMVPKIWAKQRIDQLAIEEGTTTTNKDKIVSLSVEHQVLSKYTAFLAINPNALGDGGSIADDLNNFFSTPVLNTVVASADVVRVFFDGRMLRIHLPKGTELQAFAVYNLSGRRLFRFNPSSAINGSFAWDGVLPGGIRLPGGRYIIRMETTTGIISRTVLLKP